MFTLPYSDSGASDGIHNQDAFRLPAHSIEHRHRRALDPRRERPSAAPPRSVMKPWRRMGPSTPEDLYLQPRISGRKKHVSGQESHSATGHTARGRLGVQNRNPQAEDMFSGLSPQSGPSRPATSGQATQPARRAPGRSGRNRSRRGRARSGPAPTCAARWRDAGRAARIALEAPEFLGRDDDHLVATVNGHVLRSLGAHATHQLAEARLGVPQQPAAGSPIPRSPAGFGALLFGFRYSSHSD